MNARAPFSRPAGLLTTLPLAVACMLLPPPARAAVTTSGDVTPDPTTTTTSDDLFIGNTFDGNMTIDGGSAVESKFGYIGYDINSTGIVAVDGNGSTWSLAEPPSSPLFIPVLTVGKDGDGSLVISDGGTVNSGGAAVANGPGSTGYTSVDGAGSTWTSTGWLFAGYEGNGTLEITGGGAVTCAVGFVAGKGGSTGSVTVHGAGSSWSSTGNLRVGDVGNGTLKVTGGASVSTGDQSYIGRAPGAMGSVVIDGNGSTWTTSRFFYIGYDGNASLTVSAGATVHSRGTYIGFEPMSTGTVVVDGNGSTWTVLGGVLVGERGNGSLAISNGGAVNVEGEVVTGNSWFYQADGHIDFNGGTLTARRVIASHADLRGTGAINTEGWLFDENLTIAGLGDLPTQVILDEQTGQNITVNLNWTENGIFGAEQGAVVLTSGVEVVSRSGYIALGSESTGSVTIEGSGTKWTSRDLYIGHRGTGTLTVREGATVSTGETFVSTNTRVGLLPGSTGIVNVEGAGSIWTILDGLSIGYLGSGTLSISEGGHVTVVDGVGGGNLGLNSMSTLAFSLSSTSDPFLDVSRSVSLSGTLLVDVDPALELQPGDLFTIIEVGDTLTGQFSGLDDNDVVGTFDGFDLRISYAGGDGNDVELFAVLLGDMNGDGLVDTDDVGPFLQALTNRAAYDLTYGALVNADFAGDIDHSGTFDLGDIGAFSALVASLAEGGADTVPEPTSVLLLTLLACSFVGVNRCQRPCRCRTQK